MKKQGKKWMLVVLALLAVVTVTLPLVGCKNDTVSEPARYTVTFNNNGGTGSMTEQTFTAGVAQELAANTFERKNYTFIGWSEDSKATSATYSDKAEFTATKDTTLYAVWKPHWLTFTSDSSTALITSYVYVGPYDNGKAEVPNGMEYSTDGSTWNAFTKQQEDIPFGNGTELYLRGKSSTGTATSVSNYVNFKFTNGTEVHASGDIRTLVDWQNPTTADTSNARFCSLFMDCTQLVTAPALPATKLAENCYGYMFYGCTGLTTAPELPATKLADSCYRNMFEKCSQLVTAPELPATILTESCYFSMFYDCTSLETAPELKAPILAPRCYAGMFSGCTGLTTAPELKATSLAPNCYEGMFFGCTGLTTAPELEATSLAPSCYARMFLGCTGLTTAPELEAPSLADACYANMFQNCTKLSSVTMLATNVSAASALNNWLGGTAENGTLYVNSTMESNQIIKDSLPSGKNWKVVAKAN